MTIIIIHKDHIVVREDYITIREDYILVREDYIIAGEDYIIIIVREDYVIVREDYLYYSRGADQDRPWIRLGYPGDLGFYSKMASKAGQDHARPIQGTLAVFCFCNFGS